MKRKNNNNNKKTGCQHLKHRNGEAWESKREDFTDPFPTPYQHDPERRNEVSNFQRFLLLIKIPNNAMNYQKLF